MRGKRNTEKDFWTWVDKTDTCWNWIGGKDYDGYGQWAWEGKNMRAHKFSMKLASREIPAGMISRHLCNNTSCVNPEHIVAGTQKENIQDQLLAGTFAKSKYEEILKERIRAEYAIGGMSTRKLAAKYGVSKSQVHLYVTAGVR